MSPTHQTGHTPASKQGSLDMDYGKTEPYVHGNKASMNTNAGLGGIPLLLFDQATKY